METPNSPEQEKLDRRVKLAKQIADYEDKIKELEEAVADPNMEPSAKLQDKALIAQYQAEIARLTEEHDSV